MRLPGWPWCRGDFAFPFSLDLRLAARRFVSIGLHRLACVRSLALGITSSGVPAQTISPPSGAAFGTEIDDPIRRLDHVQVVLDDHDSVAGLDEAMQHLQQLVDVLEMQAGRRFVEDVKCLAGAAPTQLAGQLDALGLAAGQGGRRLPQFDVIQADVVQGLQHAADLGMLVKCSRASCDVHLQHIVDVLVLEANLQRFAVETASLAHRASDPDVGQEVHFQPIGAVALAGLATAAWLVEAESARLVAAHFRFGHLGIQIADLIEHFDVGRRVAARRPADRRLIDVDDLVDLLEPIDVVVIADADCAA